jgi:hypothetical protein
MTLIDVRQAVAALEAAGLPVSANMVLARIGGSKRDVLTHLRTLRNGVVPEAVVPTVAAPVLPPPVAEPTAEPTAEPPAEPIPAPGSRTRGPQYMRLRTVKIARPDTPEGYMIINASDYREGLPQEMYEQGLAYNPVDWPLYAGNAARLTKEMEGDGTT